MHETMVPRLHGITRHPETGYDSFTLPINDQRSRPQLDRNNYTRPTVERRTLHHTSLHVFPSFSMAPTKTTRKNAPSTSKATQGKKEKKTASKSKATQAKGKENAASTAALQAAKKKNQLRKNSDPGTSYYELNSSTTMSSFYTQNPALVWPIRTLLLKLVGLEVTQPQLRHQQLRR